MLKKIPLMAFGICSSLMISSCAEQGILLNKPANQFIQNSPRFLGQAAHLKQIYLRALDIGQLRQNQSTQLTVMAYDDQGLEIDPALLNLKWNSQNPKQIQIDQAGRLTLLSPVSQSTISVQEQKSQLSAQTAIHLAREFTGDPTQLAELILVAPAQTIFSRTDTVQFEVLALDTQGRAISSDKLGEIAWSLEPSDSLKLFNIAPGRVTIQAKTTNFEALQGQIKISAKDLNSGKAVQGIVSINPQQSATEPTSPLPVPSPTPQPTSSSTPSTASPLPIPSTLPSVLTSPEPSPTPTPVLSAPPENDSGQFTGDPLKLESLSLAPDTLRLSRVGDKARFNIIARDAEGKFIDPQKLDLNWQILAPDSFAVDDEGWITVLNTRTGFTRVNVSDPNSKKQASADIQLSSGGEGGSSRRRRPTAPTCGNTSSPNAETIVVIQRPQTEQLDAPAIDINANGESVVTWTYYNDETREANVFVQRYDADLQAIGEAIAIATPETGRIGTAGPEVKINNDGSFVVAWSAVAYTGGELLDVYYRRYDAEGEPLDDTPIRVNQAITGHQSFPGLALDPASGNFAVGWRSAEDENVYVQRYLANGTANGEAQIVNQTNISVAWNNVDLNLANRVSLDFDSLGNLGVVWANQDTEGSGIYARRISSEGVLNSAEMLVNATESNEQHFPSVEMDSSGNMVVSWTSLTQDGAGRNVIARKISPSDEMQAEVQVSPPAALEQFASDIAVRPNGDFVAGWTSLITETFTTQIFLRHFCSDGQISEAVEIADMTPQAGIFFQIAQNASQTLAAWIQIDLMGEEQTRTIYLKRY